MHRSFPNMFKSRAKKLTPQKVAYTSSEPARLKGFASLYFKSVHVIDANNIDAHRAAECRAHFLRSMCQRNQPLSEDDLDSLRNCIFYEHRHYCKISEVTEKYPYTTYFEETLILHLSPALKSSNRIREGTLGMLMIIYHDIAESDRAIKSNDVQFTCIIATIRLLVMTSVKSQYLDDIIRHLSAKLGNAGHFVESIFSNNTKDVIVDKKLNQDKQLLKMKKTYELFRNLKQDKDFLKIKETCEIIGKWYIDSDSNTRNIHEEKFQIKVEVEEPSVKKEFTDDTDLYGEGNIDVTNKVLSNKEINQMVLKSLDSSSLKASGSESATSNQNFVSGSKSKRRGSVLEIAGIKRLKFQNGEGTAEIGINKCTEEGTSFDILHKETAQRNSHTSDLRLHKPEESSHTGVNIVDLADDPMVDLTDDSEAVHSFEQLPGSSKSSNDVEEVCELMHLDHNSSTSEGSAVKETTSLLTPFVDESFVSGKDTLVNNTMLASEEFDYATNTSEQDTSVKETVCLPAPLNIDSSASAEVTSVNETIQNSAYSDHDTSTSTQDTSVKGTIEVPAPVDLDGSTVEKGTSLNETIHISTHLGSDSSTSMQDTSVQETADLITSLGHDPSISVSVHGTVGLVTVENMGGNCLSHFSDTINQSKQQNLKSTGLLQTCETETAGIDCNDSSVQKIMPDKSNIDLLPPLTDHFNKQHEILSDISQNMPIKEKVVVELSSENMDIGVSDCKAMTTLQQCFIATNRLDKQKTVKKTVSEETKKEEDVIEPSRIGTESNIVVNQAATDQNLSQITEIGKATGRNSVLQEEELIMDARHQSLNKLNVSEITLETSLLLDAEQNSQQEQQSDCNAAAIAKKNSSDNGETMDMHNPQLANELKNTDEPTQEFLTNNEESVDVQSTEREVQDDPFAEKDISNQTSQESAVDRAISFDLNSKEKIQPSESVLPNIINVSDVDTGAIQQDASISNEQKQLPFADASKHVFSTSAENVYTVPLLNNNKPTVVVEPVQQPEGECSVLHEFAEFAEDHLLINARAPSISLDTENSCDSESRLVIDESSQQPPVASVSGSQYHHTSSDSQVVSKKPKSRNKPCLKRKLKVKNKNTQKKKLEAKPREKRNSIKNPIFKSDKLSLVHQAFAALSAEQKSESNNPVDLSIKCSEVTNGNKPFKKRLQKEHIEDIAHSLYKQKEKETKVQKGRQQKQKDGILDSKYAPGNMSNASTSESHKLPVNSLDVSVEPNSDVHFATDAIEFNKVGTAEIGVGKQISTLCQKGELGEKLIHKAKTESINPKAHDVMNNLEYMSEHTAFPPSIERIDISTSNLTNTEFTVTTSTIAEPTVDYNLASSDSTSLSVHTEQTSEKELNCIKQSPNKNTDKIELDSTSVRRKAVQECGTLSTTVEIEPYLLSTFVNSTPYSETNTQTVFIGPQSSILSCPLEPVVSAVPYQNNGSFAPLTTTGHNEAVATVPSSTEMGSSCNSVVPHSNIGLNETSNQKEQIVVISEGVCVTEIVKNVADNAIIVTTEDNGQGAPGGPMFSSEKHKKNSSNDDMSSNATEDNPEDKILSVAVTEGPLFSDEKCKKNSSSDDLSNTTEDNQTDVTTAPFQDVNYDSLLPFEPQGSEDNVYPLEPQDNEELVCSRSPSISGPNKFKTLPTQEELLYLISGESDEAIMNKSRIKVEQPDDCESFQGDLASHHKIDNVQSALLERSDHLIVESKGNNPALTSATSLEVTTVYSKQAICEATSQSEHPNVEDEDRNSHINDAKLKKNAVNDSSSEGSQGAAAINMDNIVDAFMEFIQNQKSTSTLTGNSTADQVELESLPPDCVNTQTNTVINLENLPRNNKNDSISESYRSRKRRARKSQDFKSDSSSPRHLFSTFESEKIKYEINSENTSEASICQENGIDNVRKNQNVHRRATAGRAEGDNTKGSSSPCTTFQSSNYGYTLKAEDTSTHITSSEDSNSSPTQSIKSTVARPTMASRKGFYTLDNTNNLNDSPTKISKTLSTSSRLRSSSSETFPKDVKKAVKSSSQKCLRVASFANVQSQSPAVNSSNRSKQNSTRGANFQIPKKHRQDFISQVSVVDSAYETEEKNSYSEKRRDSKQFAEKKFLPSNHQTNPSHRSYYSSHSVDNILGSQTNLQAPYAYESPKINQHSVRVLPVSDNPSGTSMQLRSSSARFVVPDGMAERLNIPSNVHFGR